MSVRKKLHTHTRFSWVVLVLPVLLWRQNQIKRRECEQREGERESREWVTGGLLYIKIYMANACENPWKRNVIIKLPDDLARE